MESQLESFEEICIEMTHRPPLAQEEVAEALARLQEQGYVEEFKPDRWQHTDTGYSVRRSLLGEAPTPSG